MCKERASLHSLGSARLFLMVVGNAQVVNYPVFAMLYECSSGVHLYASYQCCVCASLRLDCYEAVAIRLGFVRFPSVYIETWLSGVIPVPCLDTNHYRPFGAPVNKTPTDRLTFSCNSTPVLPRHATKHLAREYKCTTPKGREINSTCVLPLSSVCVS